MKILVYFDLPILAQEEKQVLYNQLAKVLPLGVNVRFPDATEPAMNKTRLTLDFSAVDSISKTAQRAFELGILVREYLDDTIAMCIMKTNPKEETGVEELQRTGRHRTSKSKSIVYDAVVRSNMDENEGHDPDL